MYKVRVAPPGPVHIPNSIYPQSVPPILREATLTDTPKNVSHRLNFTAKQYWRKRGVHKVLCRSNIVIISLIYPIQPTGSTTTNSPSSQTAFPDLNGAATTKRLQATSDRSLRSATSLQKPTLSTRAPSTPEIIHTVGLEGRSTSKNHLGRRGCSTQHAGQTGLVAEGKRPRHSTGECQTPQTERSGA